MALAAKKKPKPARGAAYGILNPFGDFWTHETFRDERAARDHIEAFWRGSKDMDTSRFRVVRARVTVSLLTPTQED